MRGGVIAVIGVAVIAVLSLAGCVDGNADDTLDVFAAASLTSAFEELADRFEAEEGIEVRLNLAGSSSLREQLLDGAPADVFAAANEAAVEEVVVEFGLEAPVAFASNVLVLAVPSGNPAGISGVEDLGRPDLFLGRCAAGVPCGVLADLLLASTGVDAAFDTFDGDVRAVQRRLIDGELDAGLIYRTDVVAAGGTLDIIELDTTLRTRYPLVMVSDSDAARRFAELVRSPEGQAVLRSWGFDVP